MHYEDGITKLYMYNMGLKSGWFNGLRQGQGPFRYFYVEILPTDNNDKINHRFTYMAIQVGPGGAYESQQRLRVCPLAPCSCCKLCSVTPAELQDIATHKETTKQTDTAASGITQHPDPSHTKQHCSVPTCHPILPPLLFAPTRPAISNNARSASISPVPKLTLRRASASLASQAHLSA